MRKQMVNVCNADQPFKHTDGGKLVSSLESKYRYVFSDVNWSHKGLWKQYLLNMLKKNNNVKLKQTL